MRSNMNVKSVNQLGGRSVGWLIGSLVGLVWLLGWLVTIVERIIYETCFMIAVLAFTFKWKLLCNICYTANKKKFFLTYLTVSLEVHK